VSNLAQTAAAVAATAVVGSAASSDTRSPWYLALDKPSIQPPAVVFPIVWTALYADIAVTGAAVLDRLDRDDPTEARAFRRALAANLVLNAAWSWVFFKDTTCPPPQRWPGHSRSAVATWCAGPPGPAVHGRWPWRRTPAGARSRPS
jgi:TspO/MBR family protein